MTALGVTIDWRMNASSLPFRTLPRSGPVVPVAPASASVWHDAHGGWADWVKTVLPPAVPPAGPPPPPPGLAGADRVFIACVNFAGGTTCTVWRIVAWPRPHSSAHTTW